MRVKRFASMSVLALVLTSIGVRAGQSPEQQAHVLVTGEIRSPGRVALTNPAMTILDVLAAAGGPTNGAADELQFTRTSTATDSVTHAVFTRQDLERRKANPNQFVLQNGDVIHVPVIRRFFISGYVKSPGVYPLHASVTVADAIALAGGLSSHGTDQGITVARNVDPEVVAHAAALTDTVYPNDELKIPQKPF
jgi:polysaccharide export outer membrane protein